MIDDLRKRVREGAAKLLTKCCRNIEDDDECPVFALGLPGCPLGDDGRCESITKEDWLRHLRETKYA